MDLKEILRMLGLAAKVGPATMDLVKAGKPVVEAIKANSPELHNAIVKLADAGLGGQKGEAKPAESQKNAEIIAKAIFTPHEVAPHEHEAIDRASNPLAGGGM